MVDQWDFYARDPIAILKVNEGGLAIYGYPISEEIPELSPTDGQTYTVQYFERNRLEYHPELPEAYRVSLGLLGVQVLQQRGWIR